MQFFKLLVILELQGAARPSISIHGGHTHSHARTYLTLLLY